MLGCRSWANAWASRRDRASSCPPASRPPRIIFRATSRPSIVSRTFHTTPMPPCPQLGKDLVTVDRLGTRNQSRLTVAVRRFRHRLGIRRQGAADDAVHLELALEVLAPLGKAGVPLGGVGLLAQVLADHELGVGQFHRQL